MQNNRRNRFDSSDDEDTVPKKKLQRMHKYGKKKECGPVVPQSVPQEVSSDDDEEIMPGTSLENKQKYGNKNKQNRPFSKEATKTKNQHVPQEVSSDDEEIMPEKLLENMQKYIKKSKLNRPFSKASTKTKNQHVPQEVSSDDEEIMPEKLLENMQKYVKKSKQNRPFSKESTETKNQRVAQEVSSDDEEDTKPEKLLLELQEYNNAKKPKRTKNKSVHEELKQLYKPYPTRPKTQSAAIDNKKEPVRLKQVILLKRSSIHEPPGAAIGSYYDYRLVRDLVDLEKRWSEGKVKRELKKLFPEYLLLSDGITILKKEGNHLVEPILTEGGTLNGEKIAAIFKQKVLYIRPKDFDLDLKAPNDEGEPVITLTDEEDNPQVMNPKVSNGSSTFQYQSGPVKKPTIIYVRPKGSTFLPNLKSVDENASSSFSSFSVPPGGENDLSSMNEQNSNDSDNSNHSNLTDLSDHTDSSTAPHNKSVAAATTADLTRQSSDPEIQSLNKNEDTENRGVIENVAKVASPRKIEEIILEIQQSVTLEMQRPLYVTRSNVFRSIHYGVENRRFSPHKSIFIKFMDEHGAEEEGRDNGGLLNESLRLAFVEIRRSSMFGGEEFSRDLALDIKALQDNDYKVAGKLMALAIAHNSPLPQFLSSELFSMIVAGKYQRGLDIKYIVEADLREVVEKLQKLEKLHDLQKYLNNSVFMTWFGVNAAMVLNDRQKIIEAVLDGCINQRLQKPFKQLLEGLETLNVLHFIQNNSATMRGAFVYTPASVTADEVSFLFKVVYSKEPEKRKKEEQVMPNFLYYLDELEAGTVEHPTNGCKLRLSDFLIYTTTYETIPPGGFKVTPSIHFRHDFEEKDVPYPSASACAYTLYLPVYAYKFEEFCTKMTQAICTPNFGLV